MIMMNIRRRVMSNKIKIIQLQKMGASGSYVPDVTDEKIQEIATAIGCSVNKIDDTTWCLFRGENNTTGFLFQLSSNNLNMYMYQDGTKPSHCDTSIYGISLSNRNDNVAHFSYILGKNNSVAFGLSNNKCVDSLKALIVKAHALNDEQEVAIYIASVYVSNSKLTFISSDGSIGYTDKSDILWNTGNENFTKLTPLTIDLNDGALIVDGAYLPICLKSTGGGHYHFTLNGKNFFLTDSDGKSSPMSNTNQLVLELPDEG